MKNNCRNTLRKGNFILKICNNVLIKLFIFSIILSPILLKAQSKHLSNKINCDTLSKYMDSGLIVEKMPVLKKSLAQTENDFLKLIDDTTDFRKTIYIKLYVDTLGTAHCPIIIKGKNNKKLDALALNFVSHLKFTPGIRARKKFGMFIVVA